MARLDERIEGLSDEIEALARQDKGCERLMMVPGIGGCPLTLGGLDATMRELVR